MTLKSQREISLMREAGRLVAEAHARARALMRPGVATVQIDAVVDAYISEQGAEALFKGFPGPTPFPAATCISVNQQIVHGIPGAYVLKEGDIVSLDVGIRRGGWCGDAAWTYAVGRVDEEKQHLLDAGVHLLATAVRGCGVHTRWSQVARDMMREAKRLGVSLVEQFVGHGIGREMHEPPQVPNTMPLTMRGLDFELRPGLVLAIEPMVNAGRPGVRVQSDGWTAVTVDGRPSVHFEHTVAITTQGPVILTEGVGDPLPIGASAPASADP